MTVFFKCHCGNTGVERTSIKSHHTKLTLEKKILPPLLPWFELATFQSRVRRSYQQAIPAPVQKEVLNKQVNEQAKSIYKAVLAAIPTWPSCERCVFWVQNSSRRKVTVAYKLSSHLSLKHEGRWGTTDDFATSFLHFPLFSTALWDLANSRLVHSLMLSTHLFLCLPCLLPPFTVPCKMVLVRLMNGRHDHTTAVCVSLPYA